MQLSAQAVVDILAALNEEPVLASFSELIEGDNSDLEQWRHCQNDAWDTTAAALRLKAVHFLNEILEELTRDLPADHGLSPLARTTDFYFHTGEGLTRPLPQGLTAPLGAFLVLDIVFNFDFGSRQWSTRPWLGNIDREHSREADPLLRLPYSRKYDHERALFSARASSQTWESLLRSLDLLCVLENRIEAVTIDRVVDGGEFTMPAFADIQDELADDDLALANGGLGFERSLNFELIRLDYRRDANGQRKPIWPALAAGRYDGVLTEAKGLSGASKKKIVVTALSELRESIFMLLHPLNDEEDEAREESRRDWQRRCFAELSPKRGRPSDLATS